MEKGAQVEEAKTPEPSCCGHLRKDCQCPSFEAYLKCLRKTAEGDMRR